jgi:hypothetical protein
MIAMNAKAFGRISGLRRERDAREARITGETIFTFASSRRMSNFTADALCEHPIRRMKIRPIFTGQTSDDGDQTVRCTE